MSEFTSTSRQHKQALWRVLWLSIVPMLIIFALFQGQAQVARADEPDQANLSVFATGLDNPRGLKFGPDGYLYVAEGGQGGSNSTVGQCDQVPSPIGPVTGGMTARISKISTQGVRTTVVDGLPSSQITSETGGFISGVADVAFLKGRLYAILAGAGCSHGIADVPNAVIRVNPNGTWDIVADLSAFLKANPVQNPEEEDFEPDGTWYSMVAAGDALYAIEPNHGELDKITPKGKISRVIDISASQGHIVPTSLDYFHGHFYVGNLETFPLVPSAAKILEINAGGKILSERTGLTNIVSAIHDKSGNLYVLESTTGNPFPTPETGMIVQVKSNGETETIASGLSLPSAMTFGPDGALYVSNKGYGYPPGMGEIVRVELED